MFWVKKILFPWFHHISITIWVSFSLLKYKRLLFWIHCLPHRSLIMALIKPRTISIDFLYWLFLLHFVLLTHSKFVYILWISVVILERTFLERECKSLTGSNLFNFYNEANYYLDTWACFLNRNRLILNSIINFIYVVKPN
jgi:hypothetical protein